LREYKSDKSQATRMTCNSEFNVHYGGKDDVVQHSKSKQYFLKGSGYIHIDRYNNLV
jgi:hypothetical protein